MSTGAAPDDGNSPPLDEPPNGRRIGLRPLIGSVPSVARVGISATVRTAQWSVLTGVGVTASVVRAAASGESPAQIVEDLAAEATERARRALGIDGDAGAGAGAALDGFSPTVEIELVDVRSRSGRSRVRSREPSTLPRMFAELLDISADVHHHESVGHPAYIRLLGELAPDEARILRLFAQDGPQPAVDVRTKRPFGVGTKLLAPGITMIGLYAGCAEPERVPAYLNNLFRLGLIWFSREALSDVDGYQVLEAQPEVVAARESVKRTTTVLRSIELTAFGKNLCALCGLMSSDAEAARATLGETSRQLPPPDGRWGASRP
jgi:hypothetical protein